MGQHRHLRALLDDGGPIAHHVPAPFLHTGPTDPAVLVTVPHWAHAAVPRVVTLHDLIPLRLPDLYLPTPAHLARYRARAAWVATADMILTNSDYTRSEAIDLLGCDPTAVVTVGAGVSTFFTPPDGTDVEHFRFYLPALEDRPFLLTIGGSDARKGTERLIAALGRHGQRRIRPPSGGGRRSHRAVADAAPTGGRAVRRTRPARPVGTGGGRDPTGLLPAGHPDGDAVGGRGLRSPRARVGRLRDTGPGLGHHRPGRGGGHARSATFDPADTEAMAGVIIDVLSDADRRTAILDAQRDRAAALDLGRRGRPGRKRPSTGWR